MGKGIEIARTVSPLHAALLEEIRDGLLIALVRRLGDRIEVPASELDAVGGFVLALGLDAARGVLTFEVQAKQ